jgi:asparagine synthase (glutamine-hydrolysing)
VSRLLRDADWAGMAHSIEIRTPLVDAALTRTIAPLLAGAAPPGKRDMADAPRVKLPGRRCWRGQDRLRRAVCASGWRRARRAPERGLRGWARQIHAAFGAPA